MNPPRVPGPSKGPETLRPILPSAGYDYRRATRHTFVGYEDVPAEDLLPAPGPNSMRAGRALIYRCDDTGVTRHWGME